MCHLVFQQMLSTQGVTHCYSVIDILQMHSGQQSFLSLDLTQRWNLTNGETGIPFTDWKLSFIHLATRFRRWKNQASSSWALILKTVVQILPGVKIWHTSEGAPFYGWILIPPQPPSCLYRQIWKLIYSLKFMAASINLSLLLRSAWLSQVCYCIVNPWKCRLCSAAGLPLCSKCNCCFKAWSKCLLQSGKKQSFY